MRIQNLGLQTWSSADPFDRLLEILSQIPRLIGTLRQQRARGHGLNKSSAENLLKDSVFTEGQLLTWFHELQSKSSVQPLFSTRPLPISPMFVSQAQDSVLETMEFSDPSTIHLMLLYWLGLVAVYASMAEALRFLSQSDTFTTSDWYTSPGVLQKRLKRAQALSYKISNRISQCQARCVGMGRGTAILVEISSLAAQRLCCSLQDNLSIAELNN